jgi:protein-S-isoprenylcysteine O-methyltransferase Ste14
VSWGPIRGISIGGVAFGVLLLAAGVFILAVSQGWITFVLDIWAVCSLGLIALGVLVLVGVIWGRRMARGGWRRWMSDSGTGGQRPPSP